MAKAKQSEAETPQYYTVLHTGVGPRRQGDVCTAAAFGPHAQIDRLVRKGAIAPTDPPEHVVGRPSIRSAHVNSAGIVDQKGLDRPDVAARDDVQILSPEERDEVVEQAQAEAEALEAETVEEVSEGGETVEGDEATPAVTRRRKK